MNPKALKTLEYTKVIARLTDYASSPLGREKCEKLEPSTDLNEIIALSKELLENKHVDRHVETDNLIDLIVNEIYKTYSENKNN